MTDTVRAPSYFLDPTTGALRDGQARGSISEQDTRDMFVSGVLVVADNTARATLFPAPASDARVYNKTTRVIERYDSTLATWVVDTLGPLTDLGKYGTLPPLPGAQRFAGLPVAAQVDPSNRVLGQVVCAIATVSSQIKTTNQVDFSISGPIYRKAATDNFWTLTGGVLAISSWRKYLLLVDSAGAASVLASSDSTTSAAAVPLPNPPANKTVFGVATIATNGATTFTPGTTLLGAAGIATTIIDGLDPLYPRDWPIAPPTQIDSVNAAAATMASPVEWPALVLVNSVVVFNPAAPYRYTRGQPVVNSAVSPYWVGSFGSTPSPSFGGLGVEFCFDGSVFDIRLQGQGVGIRIMVNGQYSMPQRITSRVAPSGGQGTYRHTVTFPNRANRRIRIELGPTAQFSGITCGTADTIWPPDWPKGPRVIVAGDSYAGNGDPDLYPSTLGGLLGWGDVWTTALGGTGYLAVGSFVKLRDRIATDVIAFNPDIIVFSVGHNDCGFATKAQIQAECTLLYAQVRAALPNVKLITTGPLWHNGSPDQGVIDCRDAIAAAVATDTGAHLFIDNIGAIAPGVSLLGWMRGTGRTNAPTGSGNADVYTSNDAVHPSQPDGQNYLGQRIASAITAAMPF
jgi:hypothetical protein